MRVSLGSVWVEVIIVEIEFGCCVQTRVREEIKVGSDGGGGGGYRVCIQIYIYSGACGMMGDLWAYQEFNRGLGTPARMQLNQPLFYLDFGFLGIYFLVQRWGSSLCFGFKGIR